MEGLKRAKAACHRKKYTFPSSCGATTTTTNNWFWLQLQGARAAQTHTQTLSHTPILRRDLRSLKARARARERLWWRGSKHRLTSALSFPLSSHSSAVRLRRVATQSSGENTAQDFPFSARRRHNETYGRHLFWTQCKRKKKYKLTSRPHLAYNIYLCLCIVTVSGANICIWRKRKWK